MIRRTCPYCHETRYSADAEGEWICPKCHMRLGAELNEEAGK